MPRLRLDPADEGMHADGGEPSFNESMYCNFYDPALRLGGFLRVGNRPNEKLAESTVCVFRPDAGVWFAFARPSLESRDRFDAAGVRFEVERPFERLRVAYAGKACALADPMAMEDPGRALRENPFVPLEIELAVRGVGPVAGGEPEQVAEGSFQAQFARGHYEQHHRASGRIAIDGRAESFDGLGLRDHSWGPRSWQAPRFYRWLTGNFGEDFGFMASWIATRDGGEIRGGFLHRGERLVPIRDVSIETEWSREPRVQRAIRARLHSDEGPLEIEGRVLSLIPLRHRRGGLTTRIAEGMTEWRCQGRIGYGLSEYLDQLS
jgi:hypothetical protein